jgi:hypothetical protein
MVGVTPPWDRVRPARMSSKELVAQSCGRDARGPGGPHLPLAVLFAWRDTKKYKGSER